ncbi:MAG: chemotaxis protein CheB [Candidatus Solibacter sp.]|jgi:two-component system chemotaxis response regulator CheB|nr:chemotaxis protein CheB [Candidatus Solibacter sp.]
METKKLIEATCPDCRGPLSETVHDDALRDYGCLVGHRYSAKALLAAHSEAQEKALWSAVVALEEAANIVWAVGPGFAPEVNDRLVRQVEKKRQQALVVRKVLEALEAFEAQ